MPEKLRIAGINFAHMHMGDLLRMVRENDAVELVGIADESRAAMDEAINKLEIDESRVFTDYHQCLEETRPDLVILCPPTAEHGLWVERVAPYDVHVLLEKPFASSLEEADRAIAAVEKTGRKLAINWPLAWYPSHVMARKTIDRGTIGEVLEVHFYDGNRGPLWHGADKDEVDAETVARRKPESWFYKRSAGGGSLLDYLGYGVTLGTWYHDGRAPIEVTATVDEPEGLEVDEHSVTVARYATGLSKFETRWGTFTDPWTLQPQPKCGFVIVGTEGTIASYDFEDTIRIQTRAHPEGRDVPVDALESPRSNPVEYVADCIMRERPIEGPLSPVISRIGQQISDTACESARQKKTLPLIGG